MKILKYQPEVCKQKDGIFKGTVSIEMPSYPQRLSYVKECNFSFNEKETGEIAAAMSTTNIDALIKMLEIARKHVKGVDIIKMGEVTYADFEEMLQDADCDEMVNEISAAILNGVKLGKNLKLQSSNK